MKRTLFLALILTVSLTAGAQEFAPVGTKWLYEEFVPGPTVRDYCFLEAVQDTIVNGRNCSKLVWNGCDHSYNTYYDSLYVLSDSFGAAHYNPDLGGFQYFVEYGLEPGDTFYYSNESLSDTVVVIILDKDTIEINGSQRMVFEFDSDDLIFGYADGIADYRYIENMGFMNSFIGYLEPQLITDVNLVRALICYQNSSEIYHHDTATPCDFTLSSRANTEQCTYSLFPNPTRSKLRLNGLCTSGQKNQIIEIYSSQGKLLETIIEQVGLSGLEIEVNDYASGMYWISISEHYGGIIHRIPFMIH